MYSAVQNIKERNGHNIWLVRAELPTEELI